jgi:hypothetical protein
MWLNELPLVIAGPIIRKVSPQEVCIWLVTSADCQCIASFYNTDKEAATAYESSIQETPTVCVGQRAFVKLIKVQFEGELPLCQPIFYDVSFTMEQETHLLSQCVPDITYANYRLPSFEYHQQIDDLLHGSCRKAAMV